MPIFDDENLNSDTVDQQTTTNLDTVVTVNSDNNKQKSNDLTTVIGTINTGGFIPPGNYIDGHIMQDSDEETASVESGAIDEDPDDPEWVEETPNRL